jgi:4-amino-4-deoxy-L-arabinose transferase-like glycosyltransferase
MMKNKWFLNAIIVLFALIILSFFLNSQPFFLYLSNSSFVISLLLLIIGLFGLVLKEGTFDSFHYSFNQWKDRLFNFKDAHQNDENGQFDDENFHRLSKSIPSSYTSFIKAGILFLLISILCILIYFFFNI